METERSGFVGQSAKITVSSRFRESERERCLKLVSDLHTHVHRLVRACTHTHYVHTYAHAYTSTTVN